MSFSRIDKFIREQRMTDSLGEASRLRDRDCEVAVGADPTGTTGLAAISAVALGLRCVTGDVRVTLAPNAMAPPWLRRTLDELLAEEAALFGEPSRLKFAPFKDASALRIGIGTSVEKGVTCDASGWMGGINHPFAERAQAIAPAAAFVVACALAKAFADRILLRPTYSHEEWMFSLADLAADRQPKELRVSNLGRIHLLGAGAIGSAFAHVIKLSGWNAQVLVVDRDRYDQPNHETSLLIGRPDVLERPWKAERLAERMRREGLDSTSRTHEVTQTSALLQEPCRFLVCGVDNASTRRALDDAAATWLLNAGLGGSKADAGHVLCTSHGEHGGRRLSELYANDDPVERSKNPPAEVRGDECSTLHYDEATLAAPFLGLAAGSLLAASCGAIAAGRIPTARYLKLDLLREQHHLIRA